MVLNLWEYFGDSEDFSEISTEEREALGFGVLLD